jgi:hypothetical protein
MTSKNGTTSQRGGHTYPASNVISWCVWSLVLLSSLWIGSRNQSRSCPFAWLDKRYQLIQDETIHLIYYSTKSISKSLPNFTW